KGIGGTTNSSVQTFRTVVLPLSATNPMPANNGTLIAPSSMLSWTAGSGATSHDVYFGTNQTNVTNAGQGDAEFRGNQPGTTFNPGPTQPMSMLAVNTEYFWRIDEASCPGSSGRTKGTVWKFTTGNDKASAPIPANNATNQDVNVDIQWTAGI